MLTIIFDSIVIGAGQSGLATAYYLKNKGLKYLVLEKSNQTAGSWPLYYDSLKLFSPVQYSSLPGLRFQGDMNHYPTKTEVMSYLNTYAQKFELNIATGKTVTEVLKAQELFVIKTEEGELFKAKTIISATGSFDSPNFPEIIGTESFAGEMIHSSQYSNPKRYANKRVIVVGAGNSAVQIAYELRKTSTVTLATRTPIAFTPQIILGKDIHYWFKLSGVEHFSYGKKLALSSSVIDRNLYKPAINNNNPDRRDLFVSINKDGVIWDSGEEEKVDTIIFATGYHPTVNYLYPLQGALDEIGMPVHKDGISTSNKGLFYVGLPGQRSFSSATLRGVGKDVKYIVNKVNALLSL
ncbi:NAD(P)/FAD-dependent oxidoreductase [Sporosarcina sp. FSL K6-1522]|uniref:flavin-containing monooxygenase n=1 Tax=Sporosarcina sp. FSL K6-1522 TaxID=2921554 RepID=UPI00315B18D1